MENRLENFKINDIVYDINIKSSIYNRQGRVVGISPTGGLVAVSFELAVYFYRVSPEQGQRSINDLSKNPYRVGEVVWNISTEKDGVPYGKEGIVSHVVDGDYVEVKFTLDINAYATYPMNSAIDYISKVKPETGRRSTLGNINFSFSTVSKKFYDEVVEENQKLKDQISKLIDILHSEKLSQNPLE